MIIRYKCQRCEKEVNAKVTKSAFKSKNYKGKQHNRLDCTECGKYIKFIGQNDLDALLKIENTDEPAMVTLDEINFKLDLIIDHLGITNEIQKYQS